MGVAEIAAELLEEHGGRGYEIAAICAVDAMLDGRVRVAAGWLTVAEACRDRLRAREDGAPEARDLKIVRRDYDALLAEVEEALRSPLWR